MHRISTIADCRFKTDFLEASTRITGAVLTVATARTALDTSHVLLAGSREKQIARTAFGLLGAPALLHLHYLE